MEVRIVTTSTLIHVLFSDANWGKMIVSIDINLRQLSFLKLFLVCNVLKVATPGESLSSVLQPDTLLVNFDDHLLLGFRNYSVFTNVFVYVLVVTHTFVLA